MSREFTEGKHRLYPKRRRGDLAEVARLLALAEAGGLLGDAIWLVHATPFGQRFFDHLDHLSEVGTSWIEISEGLAEAQRLLRRWVAWVDPYQLPEPPRVPLARLLAACRFWRLFLVGKLREQASTAVAKLEALAIATEPAREAGA